MRLGRAIGLGFSTALVLVAPPASASPVAPEQLVALLTTDQPAYAVPEGRKLEVVSAHRPITGEQTVLPVLGAQTISAQAVRWLQVELPGRPNGRRGWIKANNVRLANTAWHIVVSRQHRTVTVYKGGRRLREMSAIVGKSSTPTPRGEYFVEETVAEPPSAAGAPFALALSARSDVLQEFDGGPGQIAIHGIQNIGGRLGTAVSHGCVRLATSSIRWLASRIDPGDPVTIQ
ncbi:MAG: L,D-transpeptidase [Solirubrobacteraceae bacterium]